MGHVRTSSRAHESVGRRGRRIRVVVVAVASGETPIRLTLPEALGKRSLSHHRRLSLGLDLGLGRKLCISLQLRVVFGYGRSHGIDDRHGL